MTPDEQLAAIRAKYAKPTKVDASDCTFLCPKCGRALHRQEIMAESCETCGEIDIDYEAALARGAEELAAMPECTNPDIAALLAHIDTLTAERDEANERRAETVAMCERLTAERDRAEQMKAAMGVTLDFANHDREKLAAELAAAERDRDRYNEEAKHAWGNVKIFQDELTKVQQELAAANARADEAERELKDLAEWLRDGFDHEDDAHRYDNGACRKCRGIDVLADIARGEYEKGGGDGEAH